MSILKKDRAILVDFLSGCFNSRLYYWRGVTLIVFPIYLLIQFGSPWLLILFTFIPLGVWIDIKLVYYTQKVLWNNNHLSSYTLLENKIETK